MKNVEIEAELKERLEVEAEKRGMNLTDYVSFLLSLMREKEDN